MSSIKSALSTHITEVVEDMNKELLNDRIVSFWGKVAPELTLRQLVDTYWKDTKSEFAVDLGVTFGKIFELYLPFKLKSLGYDVEPQFSSSGDMIENTPSGKVYWELKTGRGKFIQGATHSPKEKGVLNLVQVLWDCNWDLTLDEMRTAGFISHINVCVFSETTVNSVGQHSNNNSRTTLQFTKDRFLDCVEACVWGTIKQNRVNVGFVKVAV